MTDTLILGAGMAGLLAARTLQQAGRPVLVLDKGRGVGGRMATRRLNDVVRFDHGAQFFTVRSAEFQQVVDELARQGIVREWCRGFLDQTLAAQQDGHPRYAGVGGMSAVPKHLAQGLNVRTGVRICSALREGDTWVLASDQGEEWRAARLLVTAPVPQALGLLQVPLPADARAALERIAYDPCVSVLLHIEGDALAAPGAVQLAGEEPISWIADNGQKPTGSALNSITVHAGPAFTRATWDSPAHEVDLQIREALQPYFGRFRVQHSQLHRWRYSKPSVLHPERCLAVPELGLVLAGDAFGEPRVEGAALSGLAAARALARPQ